MTAPLPLSILLLARDEAAALEALLPSLAFAREVVVVWDPHGDPATRAAAERAGARVLARPLDGFGPQRAFALAHCTQDWVLWLDADERLDAAATRAVCDAAAAPAGGTACTLARRGWFLGRPIRFCGWRNERVLRLFPRAAARFGDEAVHERVRVEARVVALPGRIEHHAYARWEDCTAKLVRYAAAGAAQALRAGRRAGPLDLLLRPPARFLRQYVLQLGVLDGAAGLALCGLAAAQVFLKYAAIWERTRARRGT